MSPQNRFEDLMAEIQDAQTVVNVANETWSDDDGCDSFLGVLDLLDHKLKMLKTEATAIMESAQEPSRTVAVGSSKHRQKAGRRKGR